MIDYDWIIGKTWVTRETGSVRCVRRVRAWEDVDQNEYGSYQVNIMFEVAQVTPVNKAIISNSITSLQQFVNWMIVSTG